MDKPITKLFIQD